MKEFRSKEDYLEAVLVLSEEGKCRCIDVAKKLGFSKPSVTTAIQKLEAEGLVKKEEGGALVLTEEGKKIASETLEKHLFFKDLFVSLGVKEATAEEDACSLEHGISPESYLALRKFIEGKK